MDTKLPVGVSSSLRSTGVDEASVMARDGVTRLTLRVGQAFAARAEARALVHDFALAQGKRAVEDKRERKKQLWGSGASCTVATDTRSLVVSLSLCAYDRSQRRQSLRVRLQQYGAVRL